MASEPAIKAEGAAAAPADDTKPELSLCDALYAKCEQAPKGTVFYQRDFVAMGVAKDGSHLMMLLQELVDNQLLKFMMWENQSCWIMRTRDEARKLKSMSGDERHIYLIIDEAQNAGIWVRAIRAKVDMQLGPLTKILKSLESRQLIKMVLNVKNSSRKMYLLKELDPSPEIAGGPWQTDGEWDMALIDIVSKVAFRYIENETWVRVPVHQPVRDREAEIARKKAQVQAQAAGGGAVQDIEDTPKFKPPRPRMIQVPKTGDNAPTTTSVLAYVNSQQIVRGKSITEPDMEQLLDTLVLDGRLEKAGIKSYRTVKGAKETDEDMEGNWNGFVDAPCGSCPVFDLCHDEGEITARTCQYFAEWLGTESEDVRGEVTIKMEE